MYALGLYRLNDLHNIGLILLLVSFLLSTFVIFTFFSALCTATIQTVIKCIIVIMRVDEFEWRVFHFKHICPGANRSGSSSGMCSSVSYKVWTHIMM